MTTKVTCACLLLLASGCAGTDDEAQQQENAGATTAAAQTNYQEVAENFLTKVHSSFINKTNTSNSNVKMYANVLVYQKGSNSYGQGADVAYLWSHENMLRALYWGARENSSKFQPTLIASLDQLDWYKNDNCAGSVPGAPPGGYGVRHGQPCFYDDNSLLGGILMDVYLHVATSPAASNNALTALKYVDNNQNIHHGVPQKPNDPDWQQKFYMSPVTRLASSYGDWAARFSDKSEAAARLAFAKNMFNQVNLDSMELRDPASGLFRGGATCTHTDQQRLFVCDASGSGVLGGNSTGVAFLALSIYRNNADKTKLDYARTLMDDVLAHDGWFPSTGGVKQNAPTGGYAIVDLLCQLYLIDGDIKWYNKAKAIVDFLIQQNRDRYGWYANGVPGDGSEGGGETDPGADTWADNRTGNARPADSEVKLVTQSAAAAALLEFAYINRVKNGN